MIHLLHAQPATYSKNPTLYRFQCTVGDVPFGVLGASASLTTGVGLSQGDVIVIDCIEPMMSSKRLSFFVGSYPLPVYQLTKHYVHNWSAYKTIYANDTLLDYFQYVAHRISTHPTLSPFFQCVCIERNGQYTLQIAAQNTGNDWSVKLTDSTIGNTHTKSHAYPQADIRPLHHQFLYQLCVESNETGTYTALPIQYGTCDASGVITLNVQDMIDAYAMSTIGVCPIPRWDMAAPMKAKNVLRYYVRVAEQYGEPLQCGEWMYCNRPENPNIVFMGGRTMLDWQNNTDRNNPYRHQTVTPEQPNYLPFQDYAGNQSVHLHVLIVHFDGTTSYKRMFQNHGIVTKQRETLIFPTGMTALQLDSNNAIFYRVTVENANLQFVTPSYTYMIDRQWQYQNAYLCFLNRLMMPQIVRFTSIVENRDYERNAYFAPYRPYDDIAQGHGSTFQVNIHWYLNNLKMNVQEYFNIVGIYDSNHVYMVTQDGFLPVSIENKELSLPQTGEFTADVHITIAPKVQSDAQPSDWLNDFSHLLKWRV